MKKIISTLFLMAICLTSFAGNPFKITLGKENVKTIMRDAAVAVVECDWNSTMYDNKITAKEKFGADYDFIVSDCQKSFVSAFNAASKGLRLSSELTEDAKYKLVLKISNVDSFFAAMSFVPRNEAKMWGIATICSVESGEKLLEVAIDEAEDGQDFVWRECFGKTFGEMGKRLAKLK